MTFQRWKRLLGRNRQESLESMFPTLESDQILFPELETRLTR